MKYYVGFRKFTLIYCKQRNSDIVHKTLFWKKNNPEMHVKKFKNNSDLDKGDIGKLGYKNLVGFLNCILLSLYITIVLSHA